MQTSVLGDRFQILENQSSFSSLHGRLRDDDLHPVLFFYHYWWEMALESSNFVSSRRDLLIGIRSDS